MKKEELSSPIIVTQDEKYYKVTIHPNDRDLAKSIKGRLWNIYEKKWVFKKNQDTFQLLKNEFQHLAEVFEISPPKTLKENNPKTVEIIDNDSQEYQDLYWQELIEDPEWIKEQQENFEELKRKEEHERQVEFYEKELREKEKLSKNSNHSNTESKNLGSIENLKKFLDKKDSENFSREQSITEIFSLLEISNIDILNIFLNKYKKDNFNYILDKNNFSFENPLETIQDIQDTYKEMLIDMIGKDKYKKICNDEYDKKKKFLESVGKKIRVSRDEFDLQHHQTIMKIKKELPDNFYQSIHADPFQLLIAANNLRNKLVHKKINHELNSRDREHYIFEYIILTRIAMNILSYE